MIDRYIDRESEPLGWNLDSATWAQVASGRRPTGPRGSFRRKSQSCSKDRAGSGRAPACPGPSSQLFSGRCPQSPAGGDRGWSAPQRCSLSLPVSLLPQRVGCDAPITQVLKPPTTSRAERWPLVTLCGSLATGAGLLRQWRTRAGEGTGAGGGAQGEGRAGMGPGRAGVGEREELGFCCCRQGEITTGTGF